MDVNTQIAELREEIRGLQAFKHRLEKQIYAGVAVAGVLGALGLFGAAWINKLQNKLDTLNERTDQVEVKLTDWDERVSEGLEKLSEAEMSHRNYLSSFARDLRKEEEAAFATLLSRSRQEMETQVKRRKADVDDYIKAIDDTGRLKLQEIQNVSVVDVLNKLKDGSQKLTLSGLNINNGKGTTVVALHPDTSDSGDGDGFIRINNQDGKMRMLFYHEDDRPQVIFKNSQNATALSYGVYRNADIGFLRLFSVDGKTKLLEIDSNDNGGTISQYHVNGNNVIYLGPDSKSGKGLLNIYTKDLDKKESFTVN